MIYMDVDKGEIEFRKERGKERGRKRDRDRQIDKEKRGQRPKCMKREK